MEWFRQVQQIVQIEFGFFLRFRKLMIATVVVMLIPAIYTLIYLSSVWDPPSHTQELPVALVNLDQSIEYQGQTFNVGKELIARLKRNNRFGFRESSNEEAVRMAVREGKLAFALIIPPDFSSNAVPGALQGAGKLVVYTSEGNNYQTAQLARRFADEIGQAINKSLNERRWALILSATEGSMQNVERLRVGVEKLVAGAHELKTGAEKASNGAQALSKAALSVNNGVQELSGGFSHLSSGIKTMDANRPPSADLNRLLAGVDALGTGQIKLGQGFNELESGSKRLLQGIDNFRAEAESSLLVPAAVVEGLDKLKTGLLQLDSGLDSAGNAHQKLVEGTKQIRTGVAALTHGAQAMGDGIHTIAGQLPKESSVKALAEGASKLATGAEALAEGNQKIRQGTQMLATGIDVLADSLPTFMQHIEGSAEGMAYSVHPEVEVDADIPNQGTALAPNVIPAALWLGAGIIAFLVNVRVMPKVAEPDTRTVQFLGKIAIPALIALIQAMIVLLTISFVLGMHILHPVALILVITTSSLTFLCIVFAMTRALGDAGKALAMLFLALQLSSSGGVLQVELSGGIFAAISPWMPMTWVVHALKASMFGAYDDAWELPFLLLLLATICSAIFASYWGKWRYVDHGSIRPAVDF